MPTANICLDLGPGNLSLLIKFRLLDLKKYSFMQKLPIQNKTTFLYKMNSKERISRRVEERKE